MILDPDVCVYDAGMNGAYIYDPWPLLWCCQPAHEAQEAVSTRDDCFLREDDGGSSPDNDHEDNDYNVDNNHTGDLLVGDDWLTS